MSTPDSSRHVRRAVRKDPEKYAELRRTILDRDGWRCQNCGSSTSLDVHHMRRRSNGGEDGEENLITLCRRCHRNVHKPKKKGMAELGEITFRSSRRRASAPSGPSQVSRIVARFNHLVTSSLIGGVTGCPSRIRWRRSSWSNVRSKARSRLAS